MGIMMTRFMLFVLLLLIANVQTAKSQQTSDNPYEPDFFPFSVWYSGGDARAPMLSEITEESPQE